MSYESVAGLPDFPIAVDGYVTFGDVEKSTARVFEGGDVATVYEFPWQGNRCEYVFWVARWTSGTPDVSLYATNEIVYNNAESYTLEEWLLPPPSSAGLLGGYGCSTPGLIWGSSVGPGNLIDAVIEWQGYERDVFGDTTAETVESAATESGEPAVSCDEYVYDDELPIGVCSQGFSVELFQESIGLDADGFFGPATVVAVSDYQRANGLAVSGQIDAATWSSLGVTANAPFPDLNGDGVVDGSEFPAT